MEHIVIDFSRRLEIVLDCNASAQRQECLGGKSVGVAQSLYVFSVSKHRGYSFVGPQKCEVFELLRKFQR